MVHAEVDCAERKYPAGDEDRPGPGSTTSRKGSTNQCTSSAGDELDAYSRRHADKDGNSKTEIARRRIQSGQPEYGKHEINDCQRCSAGASAAAQQDREAACDHPCGGDIRQDRNARNVVTEGLDRLMG